MGDVSDRETLGREACVACSVEAAVYRELQRASFGGEPSRDAATAHQVPVYVVGVSWFPSPKCGVCVRALQVGVVLKYAH